MRDFAKSGINRFRIRKGAMASADDLGNYGAFQIPIDAKTIMFVIASDGDECGWEHVSVHVKRKNLTGKLIERTPTWDEMCKVKEMFFRDEETVIQFHPPKSDYVNHHKHCLHLWRPEAIDLPRPPSALVGPKGGAA